MKHLFQAAGCRTGPSVGASRIDGELRNLGIGILGASSQLSIDGMAHGLWILRLILSPRIGERRADRQGRSHTRYDACRCGSMTRGREETRIDARRAAQKTSQW